MKDAYYFSHDYNARQDPKLQDVLATHGVAGLGIYWCIIEMMYEQGGKLPIKSVKSIAFTLHVDVEIIESVINDFELFDKDGASFWSDAVITRLKKRTDVISERKKAAQKSWESRRMKQNESKCNANAMQMQYDDNANAMQRKGKEIEKEIEKENKENSKESDILVCTENATDVAENKEKSLLKRKSEFEHSLIPFLGKYTGEQLREFADYWTEPNKSHSKMRYELERTWDTARRLAYWDRNSKPARNGYGTNTSGKKTIFEEIARLNAQYPQP